MDRISSSLATEFRQSSILLILPHDTSMDLASRILDELQSIAPLRCISLSSNTYSKRTREFVDFLRIDKPDTTSLHDLDQSLCNFGTYLYDLNPRHGCLQHYQNALFVLMFFLPKSALDVHVSLKKAGITRFLFDPRTHCLSLQLTLSAPGLHPTKDIANHLR